MTGHKGTLTEVREFIKIHATMEKPTAIRLLTRLDKLISDANQTGLEQTLARLMKDAITEDEG